MVRQRIHVSIAIEGTSNSSYLAELAKLYGADQVLIYQLPERKFIRLSELPLNIFQSLIEKGKELLVSTKLVSKEKSDQEISIPGQSWYSRNDLPEDAAAVHGYFTPSLFRGIVENPFTSIILRDPLERLITIFEEWKRSKGETDWRIQIPFDKMMDFRRFSMLDKNTNFQSRCLGNQRLGDYDLVGVYQCLPGFIAQLKNENWTNHTGTPAGEPPLQRPRYKNLGIDDPFFAEFKEANQKDYAIYQQAKAFMGFC